MCNSYLPTDRPKVKYPHSKINRPLYYYERLVGKLFSASYDGVEFRVFTHNDGIEIFIYNVNPHRVYSPITFDPSYVVRCGDIGIKHIIQSEFFKTFYAYIPDIVPYLNFQLFAPLDICPSFFPYSNGIIPDGCFEEFNLREMYYQTEGRKQYYNNQRMEYQRFTDRTQLRYDGYFTGGFGV